jgi:hypothetical protein
VLTPPPYVNRVFHPVQTLRHFSELSALQYSRARLGFHFTRPARAARLEIKTGDEVRPGRRWTLPVPLSAGGTRAAVELPALAVGRYALRLVTEAEHGIPSRHELAPLTVWSDAPPAFVGRPRVGGLAGGAAGRSARAAPDDAVLLAVAVEDRVGVDRAEVEYRVNGGAARTLTLFEAKGAPGAAAARRFRLAGKVKDGDVLTFRVRASDNRRLARGARRDADGRPAPAADLAPYVIYYPERVGGKDRWFVLRIDSRAEPLRRQEILAERDRIGRRLQDIVRRLRGERGRLDKLRASSKGRPALGPEEARSLDGTRRAVRGVQKDLADLARDAARAPGLAEVARRARDVTAEELARGGEALRQAREHAADGPAREGDLDKASKELAAAQARLEDLRRRNDRLAQDRLDRAKLKELARREAELGKQAARLAASARRRPAVDRLRAEQKRVAEDLRRLADKSKLFRDALAAVRAEEAKGLAKQARDLARDQRDLARAEAAALRKQIEKLLAAFAGKQHDLAHQAAALGGKAGDPARSARAAAESLKQGRAGQAQALQEQSADEFERAATETERARAAADDPREAVRRLAREQGALAERLVDEGAKVAVKSAREILKDLEDLRRDQEALRRAVEDVPVPPAAQPSRQAAAAAASAGARALGRRDPFGAHEEMLRARRALEQLAAQLPADDMRTSPQRQADREARADRVAELARRLRALADRARQVQERPAERTDANAASLRGKAEELARRLEREAPAAEAREAALRDLGAADKSLARGPAGLPAAKDALGRAADAVERLAKQLARERAAAQAGRQQAEVMRRLAEQQRRLREALRQALADPARAGGPPGKGQKELARKQQGVRGAMDKLNKQLRRLAQAPALAGEARQAAKEAAESGEQAGQPGKGREQAARLLEKAARQAEQAADRLANPPEGEGRPRAGRQQVGQALRQGQRRADEAQARLGQGDPGGARAALDEAARVLAEAANQAAPGPAGQGPKGSAPPGPPVPGSRAPAAGGSGPGRPGAVPAGKDGRRYAGRPWGELPGELRTRLLQDLRGRYGDDYAGIIERYFEALADTPR